MSGEQHGALPSAAEQLDAMGQAVITTDVGGRVIYWNHAAEDLYGWTAEEALDRNINELSVPDVAQDVAEEIMDALRTGVPWSGGFPCRRKDGSMFPALVTDSGIYRDGQLIGIIGVSTNLGTAVRPLLERSTDAALLLRSDAVVTYASPAVNQLFGWSDEKVVGASVIPLLHPDDRAVLGDFLATVVSRPGAHPPVEIRVRRDGDWTWVEAALTNLLDDPHVRGVVCNLRVSLRRTAQEAAEQRATQLQTALETRLVIERAKGFLAGRDGIDPETAFERMRRHARNHQVSVTQVSTDVLAGGTVPES